MVKGILGGFLLFFLAWNYYMGVRFIRPPILQNDRNNNNNALRKYPPHRYYHLNSIPKHQQPSFLTTETEYIYGEWPIVLPLRARNANQRQKRNEHGPFKIAVDQTSWISREDVSLPFADGTNPSIISVDRLKGWDALPSLLQQFPQTRFVATACMTNSQCAWKDSPSEIQQYQISTQTQPDTIRTVLLLLDDSFQTLTQATIYLERDAAWGRKLRQPSSSLYLPALDDARLFRHNQQLFVSYREGPGFGYETQVLNPIHLQFTTSSQEWSAHIRASETSSFCCGRNMALMRGESEEQLRALTWVDPVTIIDIDTTPGATNKNKRRKLAAEHKSHIHGTNGFMVEIPSSEEEEEVTFLGVAHFHRPNDRKENPYARFGHHYTHAFYTVRKDQLVGLSPEFVLPSKYDEDDGEVIQFLSGLEYDAPRNEVVIAYGINDCEAAVEVVDLQVILQFLRPVSDGQQVVDFMMPLKS
ncbi:hypothetical protein FisN_19Lh244 [Fistulifera solaris]|uniref:Uncharacterized protein n=1 Tax=Fistulifera solaris TaxID=1519565 RepID=A0A1Z5K7H1_FISSO|nr:hypothetical protein FisN_19Lh244 [Fistulifera solaris]|eukprot:GAX22184.1 hypothetical protein FisN_19Lh244 [Fistulifera solaris]